MPMSNSHGDTFKYHLIEVGFPGRSFKYHLIGVGLSRKSLKYHLIAVGVPVRTFGRPDVWASGCPDVQSSGHPGHPEVRKSGTRDGFVMGIEGFLFICH